MASVVDLESEMEDVTLCEINGRTLAGWINWHVDACYTEKINRGGNMRLTVITPELGLTGPPRASRS